MDGTGIVRREVSPVEGVGYLRARNGYLRGLPRCIPLQINPDGSPPKVFAHEQPFSRVCSRAAPALVIAGERPPRPMNRGVLGLSEDIWVLMEKCWDWAPSTRPHAVDVLVLLETASRDWVSPASEAIANLSLGCPINQHSSTTESADTMPETMFVTSGGAMGHREAAKSPPTPNGEERIAVTTA